MMNNYPYSEDELLEIASKFNKHLKSHFDTLKNACPRIDQNFIYRFKALFYEARIHHSSHDKEQITQELKLDLIHLAEGTRSLFLTIRFYIQKAFPYDYKMWEAYEYCEIEKVINDYASLSTCLEGFIKLINEKRHELITANCPEKSMIEIIELSKQINDKHDELTNHLKKIEKSNKTHQTNLNELFHLMEILNETALKCLQDDPETLKLLTFPAPL